MSYKYVLLVLFVDYCYRLDSLEIGVPLKYEECWDVRLVFEGERNQPLKQAYSCRPAVLYRTKEGNGYFHFIYAGSLVLYIAASALVQWVGTRLLSFDGKWRLFHVVHCAVIGGVVLSGVLLRHLEQHGQLLFLAHHLRFMSYFVYLLHEPLRHFAASLVGFSQPARDFLCMIGDIPAYVINGPRR
jgi:hypothetical protein